MSSYTVHMNKDLYKRLKLQVNTDKKRSGKKITINDKIVHYIMQGLDKEKPLRRSLRSKILLKFY